VIRPQIQNKHWEDPFMTSQVLQRRHNHHILFISHVHYYKQPCPVKDDEKSFPSSSLLSLSCFHLLSSFRFLATWRLVSLTITGIGLNYYTEPIIPWDRHPWSDSEPKDWFWLYFALHVPLSSQNYCLNFKLLSLFSDELWLQQTYGVSSVVHSVRGRTTATGNP
jgi:hypothetical protein